MIERELKLALDAGGWRRIDAHARAAGLVQGEATQINHYFETPARGLGAASMMVRVRRKPGRQELTFKALLETPDEPGQHSLEINSPLTPAQADALLAAPGALLDSPLEAAARLRVEASARGVSLDGLGLLGSMATHRVVLTTPDGRFTLELDHSTFAGTEDFEVECETDRLREAQAAIEAWLGELGITPGPTPAPKYARFLAALDRPGVDAPLP